MRATLLELRTQYGVPSQMATAGFRFTKSTVVSSVFPGWMCSRLLVALVVTIVVSRTGISGRAIDAESGPKRPHFHQSIGAGCRPRYVLNGVALSIQSVPRAPVRWDACRTTLRT